MKNIVVPLKLIFIENDGFHLSISCKVNRKRVNLLLDTGASRTVFDQQRIAKSLGKESVIANEKLSTGLGTKSMKTHMTRIRKFHIGELVIENFEIVLLDLSHVNESYTTLGLEAIDGVIGSDLLVHFRAVIDYGKKQLLLRKPVSR